MLTLAQAYSYSPFPDELTPAERARVVGAECALWGEHIPDRQTLDYVTYPRMSAFAEAMWGTRESYEKFLTRLRRHVGRLAAAGYVYRPLDDSSVAVAAGSRASLQDRRS